MPHSSTHYKVVSFFCFHIFLISVYLINIFYYIVLLTPSFSAVKVTGVTLQTKGSAVTLTCDYTDHSGTTLKWKKDDADISGKTADTLVIAAAELTDTAEYKCEIDYTDHGSVVSAAHSLFIQGMI